MQQQNQKTQEVHMSDNGSSPSGNGREPDLIFRGHTGFAILDLPPKEWLVEGVFGKGDLSQIYGESGSGKTFVALDLAMCCITQHPFAGKFEVTRPLNVAYLSNEGTGGLRNRVEIAFQWHEPTEKQAARFTFYPNILQFVSRDGNRYYERFMEDWKKQHEDKPLDLLILDHLTSTVPGKGDIDQAAATMVEQGTTRIREEMGAATTLIHHTGYDRSHARGATNYYDMITGTQIRVRSRDNPRTVSCTKNKDGDMWDDLHFDLEPRDLEDYDDTSCCVRWHAVGATPTETARHQNAERMAAIAEQYQKTYDELVGKTELIKLTAKRCNDITHREARDDVYDYAVENELIHEEQVGPYGKIGLRSA